VLLTVVTSSAIYVQNPAGCRDPDNGMAGVVGAGLGYFLLQNLTRIGSDGFLGQIGAWVVLVVTFAIGALFAADHLVFKLPRLGKTIWEHRPDLPAMMDSIRLPQLNATGASSTSRAGASERAGAMDRKSVAARIAAAVHVSVTRGTTNVSKAGVKSGKWTASSIWDRLIKPNKKVVTGSGASPSIAGATGWAASNAWAAPSPIQPAPARCAARPNESVVADRATVGGAAGSSPSAQTKSNQPTLVAITGESSSVTSKAASPARPDPAAKPDASGKPVGTLRMPVAGVVGAVSFRLPSSDLLADPSGGYLQSQEQQALVKRAVLGQTLIDFNVAAEVVGHMTGPVITLFELSLAPGVKVAQIASLATDIARALAVPGVRVVSPIPGKDTVGIEVPNLEKEIVRIKELMNMAPNAHKKMFLPLYLGKDASGGAIVADLGRMPHMLIAGTTGSGKSVCINSIIMSMLLTRTPEDVRFILVDPKMVEMAAFESLPHLLCPIVNDMRRAEDILEWAATKMDERYEILKEACVKNIGEYNRLPKDELYKRFGCESDEERKAIGLKMPYYVIIIDELADLIMTSSKEVEGHIIRIAQKARAVGIHLILATQRPSVNVVTGLIKSNMPCRISFRVASRQESRIVLDQNGADVLLGQGDMLFLQPGTSNLIRAQGAFVDDSEIHQVVDELRKGGDPKFNPELLRLGSVATDGEGSSGERDDLFEKGVEIVLASQRGSVSLLQRRLQVGYSRASRIIDQMAEAGLLGDYKGSQARECLITLEDWQTQKAAIHADQSGRSALNGEPTSS
jgi:S-DNA-T family DNA segregation ATPase FtsK/SpoIIIE